MKSPNLDLKLSRLINSLTKNEKRYVAIYLSRHKANIQSFKLYKAIGKGSGGGVVFKNDIPNLNENKYILYNLLLDALHNFHAKGSPYSRVLGMLNKAEILYSKGLLADREDLLLKARKLADEYQLSELKLEIVRLLNMYRSSYNKGWAQSQIYFFQPAEVEPLLNRITTEHTLAYTYNRLIRSEGETGLRLNAKQAVALKAQTIDTLKKPGDKKDTLFSQFLYHRTTFGYYYNTGKYSECYKNGKKILKLVEDHPEILKLALWKDKYFGVLNMLFSTCNYLGKAREEHALYTKMMSLDISDERKIIGTGNLLDNYIQSGEFYKGKEILIDLNKDKIRAMQLNIDRSHYAIYSYYNIALMHFGLENYSEALSWFNDITNLFTQVADATTHNMVRIIRLLIYYELKDYELLEFQLRNVQRYILKQDAFYRSENVIISFLRKMISLTEKDQIKKAMEQMRNELVKVLKLPGEARSLYFFDLLSWIESKIQNRSFGDVIHDKFLRAKK